MGADRRITVLHVFSTFAVGGPQTRFLAIANRLGPNYRHLIISMSGKTDAAQRLKSEVDFSLLPRPVGRNPLFNALRFASDLSRINPDLLVTYNWGALEWAMGNMLGPGLPHIHVEDGFGPDEAVKRLARRVWLRRISLMKTQAVVMPSRNLERIALSEWHLPRHRVVYLPNGVDLDRFGRSVPEAERPFARTPDELVIGTCAALRPEKNLGRLIRAFAAAAVPKSRLVIVGEGPERSKLEKIAQEKGVGGRVLFTGYLTKTETAIAGFDLFAMSSDTEQMPLGLLEAMAASLPAVATDVGDTAGLVAESNRPYVVPAQDEAGLAAGIAKLLADSGLRARLGADNRTKAEQEFSLGAMVNAYDRLFRQAVGS